MQIRKLDRVQFFCALTTELVVAAMLILKGKSESGSIADRSVYTDLSCRGFLRSVTQQSNYILRSHSQKGVIPLT